MKKKVLFVVLALLASIGTFAQNVTPFVTPSGHTLYYILESNQGATDLVIFPPSNNWMGYAKPSGDLIIPDSIDCGGQTGMLPVHYIGEKAFSQCDSLTSVTLPNTILGIDKQAFYDCDMLTNVNMPDSLRYIHHWAFGRCFNLTGPLVIPSKVTAIGYYSFYGTKITSLTMSDSIKSIWGGAFMGCKELRGTITLPDGLQYILGGAFGWCEKILSIDVPATAAVIDYDIDGYYFSAEQTFGRVNNINYSGSAITDASDWGAKTLNGHIENGVVYRDASKTVVTGCDYQLSNITLPSTVDTIENEAFFSNENLIQINLPEGLEGIKDVAFEFCTGLTDVTLPASLTYLGVGVFGECDNLDTLRMLGSVPPAYDPSPDWLYWLDENLVDTIWGFDSSLVNMPIVVPCHAGYAYRHAEGWSTCNNIIDPCGDEPVYYTVSIASADATMGSVSEGGEVEEGESFTFRATANDGYHFLRWNDGDTNAERTVVVTSDTTFTAYFEADGGTEGIDGIEAVNAKVYAEHGRIVVEGVEDETVRVFDIVGRQVKNSDLPAGVYLVKIGTLPARKVVVIR